MDDDTLRTAFAAHTEGQTMLTRRMVITLADMADMRPLDMVRRVERLGLCKPGAALWFRRNGGITRDHVYEARADRRRVALGQSA